MFDNVSEGMESTRGFPLSRNSTNAIQVSVANMRLVSMLTFNPKNGLVLESEEVAVPIVLNPRYQASERHILPNQRVLGRE